jgi:hypothetical protein
VVIDANNRTLIQKTNCKKHLAQLIWVSFDREQIRGFDSITQTRIDDLYNQKMLWSVGV